MFEEIFNKAADVAESGRKIFPEYKPMDLDTLWLEFRGGESARLAKFTYPEQVCLDIKLGFVDWMVVMAYAGVFESLLIKYSKPANLRITKRDQSCDAKLEVVMQNERQDLKFSLNGGLLSRMVENNAVSMLAKKVARVGISPFVADVPSHNGLVWRNY